MLAGFPSWTTLVEPYLGDLGVERFDDLPLLVQYFEDSHVDGKSRVRNDLLALFGDADIKPDVAHRQVLGLPIPDVWTTNYDTLLEAAAEQLGTDAAVYREDADLTTSRVAPKRLYKMHGSVDGGTARHHLVISRDDFERYPTTHPRFWQLLRAHFLTRSFLFVGFSLSDPNIIQIFRLARLYTGDVPRPHYAVWARPTDERERRLSELRRPDLARVGVRVVEIDAHRDVETVLARLSARCRPPRAYISGSVADDDPDAGRIRHLAALLGERLAHEADVRLMTGGVLGATVGYAMCRARHASGAYRPDDLVVIRRVAQESLGPPSDRWGSIVFDGEDAAPLRSSAFEQVRAVVVLGGTDGTRKELAQAGQLGMGVIPIGATGGAARELWEAYVADPTAVRLGQRAVDPADLRALAHNDLDVVIDATVRLMRQALSLA